MSALTIIVGLIAEPDILRVPAEAGTHVKSFLPLHSHQHEKFGQGAADAAEEPVPDPGHSPVQSQSPEGGDSAGLRGIYESPHRGTRPQWNARRVLVRLPPRFAPGNGFPARAGASKWYPNRGVFNMCDLLRATRNLPFAHKSVLIAALAILVSSAQGYTSPSTTPFTADVSGVWDLTVEISGASSHPSITLKQDGDRLTGWYEGQMGKSDLEGSLKGSEIRFRVTLKFQDAAYAVTYTGTVEADAMKGTVRFGDSGTGNWSARRKKNDAN